MMALVDRVCEDQTCGHLESQHALDGGCMERGCRCYKLDIDRNRGSWHLLSGELPPAFGPDDFGGSDYPQ